MNLASKKNETLNVTKKDKLKYDFWINKRYF